MKTILYSFLVLGILLGIILMIGVFLPAEYQVEQGQQIPAKCEDVWESLMQPDSLYQGQKEVSILAENRAGNRRWKEESPSSYMIWEVTAETAPDSMRIQLAESSRKERILRSYQLDPNNKGCALLIKENRQIDSPIIRVFALINGRSRQVEEELNIIQQAFQSIH